MTDVVRLVIGVEVAEVHSVEEFSASVQLTAELRDGRTVVLLDDRGWSTVRRDEPIHQIIRTAGFTAGPDEAPPGRTQEDVDRGHWETLAKRLHRHGVEVDPAVLRRLRTDVVLSDAVWTRLGRVRPHDD